MSKAFTSESDDDGEALFALPPLPPGFKNYMTPAGAARLAEEIQRLQVERRQLPAGDVAARSRGDKIDRRLSYLVPRLEAVEVIAAPEAPIDRVRFGARVTLRDAQGKLESWRIVGIDEMDLENGDISWMSPLASALMDHQAGDRVTLMNRQLTIAAIDSGL